MGLSVTNQALVWMSVTLSKILMPEVTPCFSLACPCWGQSWHLPAVAVHVWLHLEGWLGWLRVCCCLGSERICQELLTVAHRSLQKAESTLQQDIQSVAGWYQEERSPKAKTPNAALRQRWLLVFLLSLAFLDKLFFYPLTVTVPSTRWHSHSEWGISQLCSPALF